MEPAAGRRPVRMSQSLRLRALVNERLSAAAEDILLLFESIMAEFEEELLGAKGGDPRGTRSPEPALEEPEANRPKLEGVQVVSDCSVKPETQARIYFKEDPDLFVKQEEELLPLTLVSVKVEDSVCQNTEEKLREVRENVDEEIEETGAPDDISAALLEAEGHSEAVFMMDTNIAPQSIHPQMFYHSDVTGAVPNGHKTRVPSAPAAAEPVKEHKLHKCAQCSKVYHHSSSLFRHVLTHKEQKPFRCSICQKGFSQKPHLKAHTRTHTGERPFSCPFCARSFCNKSNMSQHLKVHTGEKPFTCSVCNTSFSCLRTLTTHTRTHTGERPLRCPHCDLRFKQQSTLSVHMRTHSGERPYSCSMCDRSFSQQRSLKKHLMKHVEQSAGAAVHLLSEENSATNETD